MSLGRPNLYIGSTLQQAGPDGAQPVLAGVSIKWGSDSRIDPAEPSTLSAQILIKGAMPSTLQIGAPVALIDPVSARTLFAGTIATMRAAPDESIYGTQRVSLTAASPLAELMKHNVLRFDWPHNEAKANRWNKLANSMPRGWTLAGSTGWDWINQGRLVFKTKQWLGLFQWYCSSYLLRYHDTSTYTPGAGIQKRLTVTEERTNSVGSIAAPAARGSWLTGSANPISAATGIASIPAAAVSLGIDWEKTFEDSITEVQVSTWGGAFVAEDEDSGEFEYLMSYYVDNTANQDLYGQRQLKVETSLSSFNQNALDPALTQIVNYWLKASSAWRPTGLQLPDSRVLDTAPLLNLLATNTRHMAALYVPAPANSPGQIKAFVLGGSATWTGKKWITDLTLGRTL